MTAKKAAKKKPAKKATKKATETPEEKPDRVAALNVRIEELEARTAKAEKQAREYKEKSEARAPMMQSCTLELQDALKELAAARERAETAADKVRQTLILHGAWK